MSLTLHSILEAQNWSLERKQVPVGELNTEAWLYLWEHEPVGEADWNNPNAFTEQTRKILAFPWKKPSINHSWVTPRSYHVDPWRAPGTVSQCYCGVWGGSRAGGAQETLCWGQKEGTAVLQKMQKRENGKYEIIPSLIIQNIIPVTTPGISSQDFVLGLFFFKSALLRTIHFQIFFDTQR